MVSKTWEGMGPLGARPLSEANLSTQCLVAFQHFQTSAGAEMSLLMLFGGQHFLLQVLFV